MLSPLASSILSGWTRSELSLLTSGLALAIAIGGAVHTHYAALRKSDRELLLKKLEELWSSVEQCHWLNFQKWDEALTEAEEKKKANYPFAVKLSSKNLERIQGIYGEVLKLSSIYFPTLMPQVHDLNVALSETSALISRNVLNGIQAKTTLRTQKEETRLLVQSLQDSVCALAAHVRAGTSPTRPPRTASLWQFSQRGWQRLKAVVDEQLR